MINNTNVDETTKSLPFAKPLLVIVRECLHDFISVYYGSEWVVECVKCEKDVYDLYSKADATEIINKKYDNSK